MDISEQMPERSAETESFDVDSCLHFRSANGKTPSKPIQLGNLIVSKNGLVNRHVVGLLSLLEFLFVCSFVTSNPFCPFHICLVIHLLISCAIDINYMRFHCFISANLFYAF